MTSMPSTHRPRLLLTATVVTALALLAGGLANLAGVPALHRSFVELGLPAWFGYFVGACEVVGGVALFYRPLAALAAAGLALIMLGAVYYHVVAGHPAEGVPALVLLLLCGFICLRTRTSMFVFR